MSRASLAKSAARIQWCHVTTMGTCPQTSETSRRIILSEFISPLFRHWSSGRLSKAAQSPIFVQCDLQQPSFAQRGFPLQPDWRHACLSVDEFHTLFTNEIIHDGTVVECQP